MPPESIQTLLWRHLLRFFIVLVSGMELCIPPLLLWLYKVILQPKAAPQAILCIICLKTSLEGYPSHHQVHLQPQKMYMGILIVGSMYQLHHHLTTTNTYEVKIVIALSTSGMQVMIICCFLIFPDWKIIYLQIKKKQNLVHSVAVASGSRKEDISSQILPDWYHIS